MSIAIGLHLFTVLPALFIGLYIFLKQKGTPGHKMLGKVWAVLMLVTALVSFYIQRNVTFSWIHILSIVSIVSVLIAIWAIRSGRVRMHQRFMTGAYLGAVVAGGFAMFTPGRFVYEFLFGA